MYINHEIATHHVMQEINIHIYGGREGSAAKAATHNAAYAAAYHNQVATKLRLAATSVE